MLTVYPIERLNCCLLYTSDESDQERAGYLRPTDVPFPADNLANRVPYMDGARPKGVY